jgi:hypothetical protein
VIFIKTLFPNVQTMHPVFNTPLTLLSGALACVYTRFRQF